MTCLQSDLARGLAAQAPLPPTWTLNFIKVSRSFAKYCHSEARNLLSSYVEPRRNPHILDMPQQPQSHLQRQRHHGQQKELHNGELQQTHAFEVFAHVPAEQGVHQKSAQ